jgi:hypothetical protein
MYFKRSQINKEGLIDVYPAKVFSEKRMTSAIIFLPIPKGESYQNTITTLYIVLLIDLIPENTDLELLKSIPHYDMV